MQVPLNRLLGLLEPEHPPEVRAAAAVVLGEVGARDAKLSTALSDRLEDGDPAVRLRAIQAVAKLRVEQALPRLLERVKVGGEEAEQAALAAARLGARGTRALQELMPRVAPGLRRYIAAALAAGGNTSAEAAAVAVLLDKDPGVVEAAVRTLAEQVPTLSAAHRRAWAEQLLGLVGGKKKTALPPVSEAAVVRLLAALDDPRVGPVLWDRILPDHPPEVRTAALQALSKWAESPSKDQLKRLFACAADRDFRVAAPALLMLRDLPVSERTLPEWLSLLAAPDLTVRQVALEKVGDRDAPAVAAALLAQLDHPDRGLREAALARLTRLKHGRAALTRALLGADSPDRAWPLAKAQAPFVKDYPAAWRDEVFEQACEHLEAGDRQADPLLFLLREADAHDLRDRLEARAEHWRKKKDYPAALLYLRLLARDPACAFPTRLELAACGLKVSGHDLAADARAADPTLQQFIHLAHNFEAELLEQLPKLKWLDPDDLYYLGFHLAEQDGRARQVGAAALNLVLKRSPRSKLAQAAKSKLRSAGVK
jgi:HEAT repeat protein